VRVATFDYELPPELIAQRPVADREDARLLVLPTPGESGARTDTHVHARVGDLAELLPRGALLVVNDTRVVPARLLGQKRGSGGKVEIFLVRKVGERLLELAPGVTGQAEIWRAMGRASKALRDGMDIEIGPSSSPLLVRLLGRAEDGLLEVGLVPPPGARVADLVALHGHVPLPPYIRRDDDADDLARYQTVFARVPGAVAAPTAGLHLTHALLGRLAVRNVELATVTLHVGLGTFQPVTVDDLDAHPMHAEEFEIAPSTAEAIAAARARGAPVVAVGTTVARALESAAATDAGREGHVDASRGETRLLIQPGHRFRVVDVLMTNFHLPRSTLLAMVCAFGGLERVLSAYRLAAAERYRFFSYGDAMLLWPASPRAPFAAGAGDAGDAGAGA
jgi:S-adenosylmethionine:tRNA ribosyltransferase-isomerase